MDGLTHQPSEFMFNLTNNDSNPGHELRPLGGPWSFFRRIRILAGGQVIEDIDNYNKTHDVPYLDKPPKPNQRLC